MNINRDKEDGVRMYYSGDGAYPSVSEVKNYSRDKPWLDHWRNNNDGTGDNPHYEEILEYTQNRGTLVHYNLLNPLADREMWSDDEQTSLHTLRNFGTYKYKKCEERKDAWKRYKGDVKWAKRQWDNVKDEYGIDRQSVVAVEEYTVNREYGYGGQVDLVYENPDGETVLCDLKTSKSINDGHKIQLSAYLEALDYDIDKCQIVKLHPDYEYVNKNGYVPVKVGSYTESDLENYWDKFYRYLRDFHLTHDKGIPELFLNTSG